MAEAIISRRGSNMSGSSESYTPKIEVITTTQVWTVPKAENDTFDVLIFGGGGAGMNGGGGGGGWMNNNTLILGNGATISITIGKGSNTGTGGTTTFGTYLSASGGTAGSTFSGGSGGSGGGGWGNGGRGY